MFCEIILLFYLNFFLNVFFFFSDELRNMFFFFLSQLCVIFNVCGFSILISQILNLYILLRENEEELKF